MRPAALLFDFNGTLSDDEHIQCEIYQEIFAEEGKPLGATEYFARARRFVRPGDRADVAG